MAPVGQPNPPAKRKEKDMTGRKVEAQKQCTKCKKRKARSEFYENKGREDGLGSWCKGCMRKASKKNYARGEGCVRKRRIYEEIHRVVNGIKQKQCLACKEWKDESGFYVNNGHKDGLGSRCKACSDKAANKWQRGRWRPLSEAESDARRRAAKRALGVTV